LFATTVTTLPSSHYPCALYCLLFQANEQYENRPKRSPEEIRSMVNSTSSTETVPSREETPPPTIVKELKKYVKLYKMTGKNENAIKNRMEQVCCCCFVVRL
jgi:hypothetical protein